MKPSSSAHAQRRITENEQNRTRDTRSREGRERKPPYQRDGREGNGHEMQRDTGGRLGKGERNVKIWEASKEGRETENRKKTGRRKIERRERIKKEKTIFLLGHQQTDR